MKTFYKATLTFFCLWGLFSFFIVFYVHIPIPVLSEAVSLKKDPFHTMFQSRKGVLKEIWICSAGNRFYYKIESPASVLCPVFQDKKLHLVETLKQVNLFVKEPNANVHILQAPKGEMDYQTLCLTTFQTFLSTRSSNQIAVKGLAEKCTISFNEVPLTLQAVGVSAHIKPGEL